MTGQKRDYCVVEKKIFMSIFVSNSQNILMKIFENVMFQPKTSSKVTLENFQLSYEDDQDI